MKAAIYNPYLDTLGGGEKYALAVAETMLKMNWSVDFFWSKDKSWLDKAQKRFSLNLKGLNIVPDPFNSRPQTILSSLGRIQKIKTITKKYDHIFYVSDGSIPFLFAKNNILHFQVPFKKQLSASQNTANFIRFRNIKTVVCNSRFTKKFIDQTYKIKSKVVYPPIDTDNFKPNQKVKIILSVARFDNIMNAKRQDILIKAFKKIHDHHRPGWKLILAGASIDEPEANTYLVNLKNQAKDYPVEFIVNRDFSVIQELYSQASIFWHAAGYGINEQKNPELVEHFGMTTIEAMSAGAVPVIMGKGGVKEVINHETDGYLWEKEKKLIAYTKLLMDNPKTRLRLSLEAQKKAQVFSKESFAKKLKGILNQD